MQPLEFRYTLTILGIDSYVLPNAPSGWDENTDVEFKRSETYFGAIRSLTIPLKFTLDGAWLLRKQYYRYNVQAQAYILIEKQDPSTWLYETAYYGKIDFSKAKDEEDYFTVNAIEADLSVKIKAFEAVKYEIDIDVPEAVDIQITPLKLVESADLIFTPSLTDQQPGYPALSVINNEVKSTGTSVKDAGYRTDETPDFATDNDWFYTAQTTNDVTFKFDGLKGFVQSILTGTNRFRLQLVKNDGTILATIFDITKNGGLQGFEVNAEYVFNIAEDEKVFLYQRLDGSTGGDTGFNYTDGTLSLSYETITPPSMCKALPPKYVFQQLVKKMNGNFDYPVQSFLLDQWKQLTITSGDAIRQIPGAKLKISFADFFKSISAVTCAGHAVENGKATLEARQSYYRNSETVSMLDSKDVDIQPAVDLMFNTIKTGYPDQTYDEVNGRDEVNSIQNYVIDTYAPVKELDITSVIRADAYGIEFLRINLDGKNSTDSDSDNDPFFIYTKSLPEAGETYYRPLLPVDGIAGVAAGASYYNWYISPHRNLLRWGAFIRSVFYGNNGYQIRFVSGLKNTNMIITDSGFYYKENASIVMAQLSAPYFQPHYATFTTRLPDDIWMYINSGVYGYGKFTYVGVEMNGFFIEAGVDLSMNSERVFKCLLTANNNLLELVR